MGRTRTGHACSTPSFPREELNVQGMSWHSQVNVRGALGCKYLEKPMFIPMTAVTNYHELGGLTHMDRLMGLEARSPRWVLGGVTRPRCCLEVLEENPFLAFFGFQRLPAFPGTFLGSSQGLPPSLFKASNGQSCLYHMESL